MATAQTDDSPGYSIGELAERAEVTSRTIRYYAAEGLLPAPTVQGKYARYSNDHLQRLRLIAQLKAAYLPLHEIRAQIATLDSEQVTAMLSGVAAQRAPSAIAEPSSAAEYITNLIGRQQTVRVMPASTSMPAPVLPPSAAPLSPVAAAPLVQARARVGPLQRLFPGRAEPVPEASAEQWQRIPLAPGIELHIREPVEAQQALVERIRQLVASESVD